MATAYHFRDSGLRPWPLRAFNRIGAWFARSGHELPSLDAAAIAAAARRHSGCDDLGGDSYREPLTRYVDALKAEAELSAFGRIAVRRMLTSALSNRAKLHAWAGAHPAVRSAQIASPWVIVGLPRTGTTLLCYLLSLDPVARAPLHWETAAPIPPPTLAAAAEDPRIAVVAKQLSGLHRLNPSVQAMHAMGATLPEECVALFLYDLRTLAVETQAFVPSYGRWLADCDMGPAYAQHRLALQALQSAQPTERWVLKTPNHLWCLPTLLAHYPDARIVWTHRDPVDVVTSLASLVNALQRTFSQRRDPRPVANDWLAKARSAVERGLAFDAAAGDGWCHHLRYDDLVGDPVGAVRRLYAHFGDDVSPLHARRMQAWLRDRPQQAFGRHVYDPADFGWTRAGLAEDFREYRARFGV